MHIAVIGAGPGGYSAAFEAARLGAEVTLIEGKHIGGTCLNCGCIPTKTLVASAELLEHTRRAAEFGVAGEAEFKANMPAIMARKRKVTATLAAGLERTCAQLKIRLLRGTAHIEAAGLLNVIDAEEHTQAVSCDKIIIAAGSKPVNLPSLRVDNRRIFSSDGALEQETLPNRLIIVGGGVIGCELACIFRTFGSKVTIVEGQDRLLPLPSVDRDMSLLLQREMKKRGVAMELCRTIISAAETNSGICAVLGPSPFVQSLPESAKKEYSLEADAIFVTVGRAPDSAALGLDAAGIATDKRGYIIANECFETSVPGIYAVGDILGPQRIMLAHMAETEGIAAAHACLGQRKAVSYSIVPSGIFVTPEIADAGLTEEQAKNRKLDIQSTVIQFRELGKAQAMGELAGLFKIIAERPSGKILGVHIAGAHATDLIAEAALALHSGLSVHNLAQTIHAHPTLAEGLLKAAQRASAAL